MRKSVCLVDKIVRYDIHDVAEYINWSYFFHAWDIPQEFASVASVHDCPSCRRQWVDSFGGEKRECAVAASSLFDDAMSVLAKSDGIYAVNAVFMLFEANSDGDDIMLGETRVPMLRQQTVSSDGYCWCLSDFVRAEGADKVGVFATSVDEGMQSGSEGDDYERLLAQTLADRLAEAAAERLHEEVRKSLWGYAPDENLSVGELHRGVYQGIRPAVGYPCMPDMSINFILDDLCHLNRIGISLTESGMMMPHASVSGLMLAHPASRYFSVGNISSDQVEDYAARRGLDVETMKKYLQRN